jgi:hypothetical protein
MLRAGAPTSVVTVLVQFAAAGQVGSPPPLAVAVLTRLWPFADAAGVTGMTKAMLAPGASPAAIMQFTTCPVALQPAGSVPMVSPAGSVSLSVAAAVVAALPLLLTVTV